MIYSVTVTTKKWIEKKMMSTANNVKDISNCSAERFKWRLLVSNAEVPELYCLPNIHKPGDKMRPMLPSILPHAHTLHDGG